MYAMFYFGEGFFGAEFCCLDCEVEFSGLDECPWCEEPASEGAVYEYCPHRVRHGRGTGRCIACKPTETNSD